MRLTKLLNSIGPGPIIAAAFIGPGTVTVCTLAGVNFDYSLLWAVVLSVIVTMILQETSGRIGIITRQDLSQLVAKGQKNKFLSYFSIALVFLAIGMGNAAYESGNISGATLGLQVFGNFPQWSLGGLTINIANLLLGIFLGLLLWFGSFKVLQRVLVALVIILSIAFLLTAALTKPDWGLVFSGLVPNPNSDNLLTIVSLIGTTVVPYNLFLYASLAKDKWTKEEHIPKMRRDILVAVGLGGIVSMAIVLVGAANTSTEVNTALDLAKGLEGVFGSSAKFLISMGLLGAGVTSSLTAPLATGLVICGMMGWDQQIKSTPMRITMLSIIGLGVTFSSLGIRPVQLITLAQLANGILLPLISGYILWIGSQHHLLGKYRNSFILRIVGVLIWLITCGLGLKSISLVFNWL